MSVFFAKAFKGSAILLWMKACVFTMVRGPHDLCSLPLLLYGFLTYCSPHPPISFCSSLIGPLAGSQCQKSFPLCTWGPPSWAFSLTNFLSFCGSLLKRHLLMRSTLTILFPFVTHFTDAPNPSYLTVFFPNNTSHLVIYNLLIYCVYHNCVSTTNLLQEYKLCEGSF